MAGTYASRTKVDAGQSIAEIERTLERYGATDFAYMKSQDRAVVVFQMRSRRMKMTLLLPQRKDFLYTATGKPRTSESAIDEEWQQHVRQRWRALLLVIKAKLEAIDSGIETFEQAWMPYMVLPNGQTATEWMNPQITVAYETNEMPPLMLGAGN